MTKKRTSKSKGTVFILCGLLLLLAACLLAAYNLWDDWRAKEAAKEALRVLSESTEAREQEEKAGDREEIPAYILYPEMEMPAVEIDGYEYIGVLEIPVLDLTLPVIEEWSYPALKEAPCRYSGTAYTSGFVIAGHNYRSHFNPLKNLAPGDELFFTDIDGNVFSYTVAETVILEPQAVEEMISGSWDLTLFTCTYGGRTRLTVRCTRNGESALGQG